VQAPKQPDVEADPVAIRGRPPSWRQEAKESPDYRFYALYDKVYRRDVLEWAYVRCRVNGGAPGVDGQTFEDIETYSVGRWLDELAEALRKRTYSAYNGASPPLQSRKNSVYNAYAGFLFRCYFYSRRNLTPRCLARHVLACDLLATSFRRRW
jgi:hypothetical protein